MADIRWNERAGRFTNARGEFVSERAVRAVVDQIADAASDRMAAAAQAMLDGRLSLGAFQAEMQAAIKVSHVAAAVIAHGGREQMTPARWGAIGPEIRAQYGYLRDFAAQVADGRQRLDGSLTARSRQYGQQARVVFERTYGADQRARGYRSVKNVLAPVEHCALCRSLAARGWMPIEQMVPIGQRTCRGNDRCQLRYRREEAEAA